MEIFRFRKVDVLNEEGDVGEIFDYSSSHLPIVQVDLSVSHVHEPLNTFITTKSFDVVDCGR
jgi:hypothetical protein